MPAGRFAIGFAQQPEQVGGGFPQVAGGAEAPPFRPDAGAEAEQDLAVAAHRQRPAAPARPAHSAASAGPASDALRPTASNGPTRASISSRVTDARPQQRRPGRRARKRPCSRPRPRRVRRPARRRRRRPSPPERRRRWWGWGGRSGWRRARRPGRRRRPARPAPWHGRGRARRRCRDPRGPGRRPRPYPDTGATIVRGPGPEGFGQRAGRGHRRRRCARRRRRRRRGRSVG